MFGISNIKMITDFFESMQHIVMSKHIYNKKMHVMAYMLLSIPDSSYQDILRTHAGDKDMPVYSRDRHKRFS